mgnify:CR=1 FL=1
MSHNGLNYRIPTAELQFYQSAIHGSVYHPFDTGYFWSSLLDMVVILSKARLDFKFILEMALKQNLSEYLAIMIYIVWKKLGLGEEFWRKIKEEISTSIQQIEKIGELIWEVFLNPYPISFVNLSLLLSKTSLSTKLKALFELLGLSKGVKVVVEEKEISQARPSFISKLTNRLKILDFDLIRLMVNMARLYRKTNFTPIP